jgi:hypothetical protein
MWYAYRVLHRIKPTILATFAIAIALSATACTSLTRPEEITISAEPIASRAQNEPAAAAPGGMPTPMRPAPAAAAQGG